MTSLEAPRPHSRFQGQEGADPIQTEEKSDKHLLAAGVYNPVHRLCVCLVGEPYCLPDIPALLHKIFACVASMQPYCSFSSFDLVPQSA